MTEREKRQRVREVEIDKVNNGDRKRKREIDTVSVCVCVCVCEREREKERETEIVYSIISFYFLLLQKEIIDGGEVLLKLLWLIIIVQSNAVYSKYWVFFVEKCQNTFIRYLTYKKKI